MSRRFLKLTGLLLAAALAGAANGEGGETEFEDRIVYQIDITAEGGKNSSFDRLVVQTAGQTFVAKGWRGFGRSNQDRVDYSAVPFLGQLSGHRYDKEDFSPANQVGTAFADGDTLTLVLNDGVDIAGIYKVAVLNQEFAYETRARIDGGDWKSATTAPPGGSNVGGVFLTEDGRLAALIRPFVVTDSALW